MQKLLQLIGLVGGAYALLNQGFSFVRSKIDVGQVRLRMTDVNFKSMSFDVFIALSNKTGIPINIDSVSGSLLVNGQVLSVLKAENIVLGGNEQKVLTVSANIQATDFAGTVIKLFTTPHLPDLFFDGVIRYKGIAVPIKQKIEYI